MNKKKAARLSLLLGGSLLLSGIVGTSLSSCIVKSGSTIPVTVSATDINWSDPNVMNTIVYKDGVVYKDINYDEIIAVLPTFSKQSFTIPNTVKKINEKA